MDLKSACVLVTATSFGKDDPTLKKELEEQAGRVVYNTYGRPMTVDELISSLSGCDGVIAGLDSFNAQVIQSAKSLKVIARYGVGVDRVDLQAAREARIVVTNTPGANAVSVAELTIGLIICLARSIPEASASIKAGNWPRYSGLAIEGKTIGLVGLGAIGKRVAERLLPFNCRLVAYDPFADLEFAQRKSVNIMPLPEVLAQSDFVSLHLPITPQTQGLVNQSFLDCMKPGAFLINTARGELIDEQAVYAALICGHLRGAAIDVFTKEPPGSDNSLVGLPQVLATPHLGAHSDGATNAMGRLAMQDCLAVLSGKEPQFRVV